MRKFKLIIKVIINLCTLAFWRQAFGFIAELSLENGNALTIINKGKNTPISASASFRNPENITIGDRSNVNLNCVIWAGKEAKVIIGKDCLLGPKVSILAYGYNTAKQDFAENIFFEKDIIIGNDVWLGANVVVLPGSTIGDGAIVGAGTVVIGDIPPYTVVAGVPAQKLKDRLK